MQFPHPPRQDPTHVYQEETDHPLPAKLNPGTRYAFFKTIARGGKSIIQSCKDLHLQRVICHKSLRKELREDKIEAQRFLREARVTAMLPISPPHSIGLSWPRGWFAIDPVLRNTNPHSTGSVAGINFHEAEVKHRFCQSLATAAAAVPAVTKPHMWNPV